MSKKSNITHKKLSFYESIIFIFYLCIGFIPNLQAVDKIAPQWLLLGVLNFFAGIFILKNKKIFDERISIHFKSGITLFYAFFIIWGGISFFYAINPTEVLVNISRQFNVFFMYTNMAILLTSINNKSRFFSLILTVILSVEIYFIFYQAFKMISSTGQIDSGGLTGVTANRNIAAFSIALKIPFVLYLSIKSKTFKFKTLWFLITTLSIMGLLIIQSRASYLALGMITVAFSVIPYIFFKENTSFQKIKILLLVFLPLLLSITANKIFFASKGADAISRASTISFSTNDGSVNQRLRYYSHVLTHLKSNPILGVGLGNWKFKSIEYDKENMNGYVVPYHAHSDFIQIGAELGLFGFFSYLGIFILAVFLSLKLLLNPKFQRNKKLFIYLILTSLGVYVIDANLNFPIARPQVITMWTLIIGMISFYYNSSLEKIKIKKIITKNKINFFALLILIGLASIPISYKVYGSLKNQMYLLRDYNTNKFNTSINQLEAMDMKIPNVTVTTIPLESIKARYYINQKEYDKALNILKVKNNPNPYLFFTESLKSRAFLAKGNIDSAYYYSKKAYFGLPNNTLHVANFVKLAMYKKDRNSIEKAGSLLRDNHRSANWQNIITAYIDIMGIGDKKLIELTNRAIKIFPGNPNFLLLRKLASVSQVNISKGAKIAEEALSFFNNKNYKQASVLYLKAINEDPMEYSYYENVATCFYQLKEYGNAMLYSSKVISKFNPRTGKSEYLHGISKISTGDLQGGCEFISKAIKLNFLEAQKIKNQFCKS